MKIINDGFQKADFLKLTEKVIFGKKYLVNTSDKKIVCVPAEIRSNRLIKKKDPVSGKIYWTVDTRDNEKMREEVAVDPGQAIVVVNKQKMTSPGTGNDIFVVGTEMEITRFISCYYADPHLARLTDEIEVVNSPQTNRLIIHYADPHLTHLADEIEQAKKMTLLIMGVMVAEEVIQGYSAKAKLELQKMLKKKYGKTTRWQEVKRFSDRYLYFSKTINVGQS